jgi:phage terminase large subunit GpA-like protein
MDCLSPYHPASEVVFQKSAQIGGTECGNNWLGFIIDYAPGPTLAVQPTCEMARKLSKQRIDPLIEECSRIKSKVAAPRAREGSNTIFIKEFPGGLLSLTGANSAVGLRQMPCRYLFLDEIDGYPLDVDEEGDPIELAKARTRTFGNAKILEVSTPTIEGRSRISKLLQESDYRKFYVPCPICRHKQDLRWKYLKWPGKEFHKTKYQCVKCGELWEEYHKEKFLAAGEWRPTKKSSDPRLVGFHINALYSPLGWFSWEACARSWNKNHKNPQRLRVFVNTVLGETWKDSGDAPDWQRLYERRETYKIGTVPEGVYFLTAGVDIQADRIHVLIDGWGPNLESWSIDYVVLDGDTSSNSNEVWAKLERLLGRSWQYSDGRGGLPITRAAIDSGYNSQVVYNFVRKFGRTKVIAVKGSDSLQQVIFVPKAVDVQETGRKKARGCQVWPVGSSTIKTELYGFLRQSMPVDGCAFPHGFCHFPEYGPEFFKELTAEQVVTRHVRGYIKYQWEKIHDRRNEALDCRVYSRAAAALVGIDRFTEDDWRRLKAKVPEPISTEKPKKKAVKRRRSNFWT